MDNEKRLENNTYLNTRRTTWFARNAEKVEIFILFLIACGLFFFGFCVYFNTKAIKTQNSYVESLLNSTVEENTSETIVIVNSNSEEVYNSSVDHNTEFTLENLAIGSYMLKNQSNILFETKTNANKITCNIGDSIDAISCNVEEVQQQETSAPTEQTPEVLN